MKTEDLYRTVFLLECHVIGIPARLLWAVSMTVGNLFRPMKWAAESVYDGENS